ncbi:GlxA family transcriptional regulator [Methylovirgula sp. 4M-Z18]|uniref:GlxA family transcriptional regulator n=1 Tax=Methylovirgula sp. 4M-Z18 TaxID=2293567 RepID=UPI000E2F738D|nr:GlxA family transcriptional regulator [Methylovirgula sp. 4M-Z18]RFB79742.1 GlxA family transcriptional regulator [Methylovirgula sp. 4M-Z18]
MVVSVTTAHPRRPLAEPQQQGLRVGFVLAKDFTMSALALFIDTLRLAGDEGDRSRKVDCDWEILSATGRLIRSSTGIEVAPTAGLGDPRRFSHIAVVGGLLREAEQLDAASRDFLFKANAAQVPLIGICTGAFILAECGLLQGRRACVSWFHYHDFRERFPEIGVMADRLFFVDGSRITCAGGAGAADVAAFLVERHLGRAAKQKAMQVLQIERARGPSDPQPRNPFEARVTDKRVRRALLLMEQNLGRPKKIRTIASQCGITPRGLERLFLAELGKQPSHAYMDLRMEAARQSVAFSMEKFTEVGLSIGFLPSSFSKRFKEAFGMSPTQYRSMHQRGE